MNCDKCGTETPALTKLKHVKYTDSLITELIGTYQVCNDCHEHMKESENWHI